MIFINLENRATPNEIKIGNMTYIVLKFFDKDGENAEKVIENYMIKKITKNE